MVSMISIKNKYCYYYTVSKTAIVHVCSSTLNIYETAMPYYVTELFSSY